MLDRHDGEAVQTKNINRSLYVSMLYILNMNTCGYNKRHSNLPDADCGPIPGGGGCRGGPPRAGSGWCRCRCVCACACVCVCAAAAAAATAADWCSPAICSRIIGSAAIAIRCSDWSHSADSRSAIAGSTTQTTGSLIRSTVNCGTRFNDA